MYQIRWTKEADEARSKMSPERVEELDEGVLVLAENPYNDLSAPINGAGNYRTAPVADRMFLTYGVIDQTVIMMVLDVFDTTLVQRRRGL